ncbi:MAG: amidohydrolase family protein [Phycisphaerales bacterium]|nr:amidohydrolase family protein [Phycisphaerales bacterium]
MKSASVLAALAIAALHAGASDPLAPRPNGMAPARPGTYLITDATIHTAPGSTLEDSDLLIVDGRIAKIGTDLQAPGAQLIDLDGVHLYAGFIDPYIVVDAPAPSASSAGRHWNDMVTPQRDALSGTGLSGDQAEKLREQGFTSAMIAPGHGVFRGWSAIVSTAEPFDDPSMGSTPVYKARAAQIHGFETSDWSSGAYPTSHMGVMALLRQTFIDAEHRAASEHADASCLDSVSGSNLNIYDTRHELEALLAGKVAGEFHHEHVAIVGNGNEHRRLDALKDLGFPIITPLNFPKAPDVFSIGAADSVDLAELQSWERAPANARWLDNSGLTVALTTSKLPKGQKFWDNLHTAIEKGLAPDRALAMLTTNPAEILGLNDQGTLAVGHPANIVLASGNLFDPEADAKILDLFVDGRKHHISDAESDHFDGHWTIRIVGAPFTMWMDIDGNTITATEGEGDDAAVGKARKVTMDHNTLSFLIDDDDDGTGTYVMTGTLLPDGMIRGTGMAADQSTFEWTATKDADTVTTKDFAGTWDATLNNRFELSFKVKGDKVTVVEHTDADDITQDATEVRVEDDQLKFNFEHKPFGMEGVFRIALAPPTDDALTGDGEMPGGKAFPLSAVRASKDKPDADKLPDLPEAPFGSYAYTEEPKSGITLITGATIWTQTDDGILEDGWILVRDGKIMSVGTGGYPRIAVDQQFDATGMHITPGLIDAHSHTGLFRFGVNESGQAVTSEVRISDSLDPAHPGFYRELAGGLTTANLLHGSANPIGGQSQTIKLRWNADKPEDMFFEGAKPGIKFALGENVKQSNWGDDNTTRYPQTRMGVETIMRDRFTKAREYATNRVRSVKLTQQLDQLDTRLQNLKSELVKENERQSPYYQILDQRQQLQRTINELSARDLELEALAEILAGDRLVHCHSYRQDEILMLCRLAEEFGFKIGTFQHGLETYKVAEIVKEHAIGASIFSDWWAYKVEVQDAIPYAGPINHAVGLLTSYNSDSDDLARRMNVEAGKAFKYAKMSGIEMTEQEALAFVTTNPAIQLGIDARVGTLEPGKDADIAVWTGNPLSSLSRCEMTFVDGKLLFSRELDAQMRTAIATERQRLIQKILTEGKPEPKPEKESKDDDTKAPELVDPNYADHYSNTHQGDCGCNTLHTHWTDAYTSTESGN